MNKFVDFDKINYVAATFPVNSATQAYLKANHTNPQTGNVDINGKKLAVKLDAKGEVGFGASTPTTGDELLGVIMAYEMDGFATVQIAGGIDNVPTKEAITGGQKLLAVNDKGQIEVATNGRATPVVKPSASENLFASIVL